MADFTKHLDRALENIHHLLSVNESFPQQYRWQIVATHYIGLHLVQAFLADKVNAHPDSHHELKKVANPYGIFVNGRLPVDVYSDYELLENLSRKARYNCEMNITEEHLIRAIKYIDPLIAFFQRAYSKSAIPPISILCDNPKLCCGLNHVRIVERTTVEVKSGS